ncbi:MAG: vWA domain-containing protein [Actinomycetota bacterium]
MTEPASAPVHISVVLDRSGSMQPIADDIVGGFNAFLAEQRARPGAVRLTLAQFDSREPFEVLIDGADLHRVPDLARSAYQPRGSTPLYDAVGQMVAHVDDAIAERAREGLPEEDQVVAIVTDGLENHSMRFNRADVFRLIEERRRAGWVFVFLGADQDAYAAGGQMGFAPRGRVAWEKTPEGVKKMWGDLSHSTDSHRAKPRERRRSEADEFHTERPEEK